MSGRDRERRGQPANTRMNEYFVPRDGIDREVITADICRYLGNDALVRPGNYTDDQSGRTIQGYYITAYRNLTTAMIADLKQDSARWEQERRRDKSGSVRYQDSAIHRMGGGVSSTQSYQQAGYTAGARDAYGNDYGDNDTSGYATAGQSAGAAYAAQPGYGASTGYVTAQYQTTPTAYGTAAADPRYATGGTGATGAMGVGYTTPGITAQSGGYHPGAAYGVRQQDQYADVDMGNTMQQPRTGPEYATIGGQRTYMGATPQAGTYQYQTTAGPTGTAAFAAQPVDNFYGRGVYPATTSAPGTSDYVASSGQAGNTTVGYSPVPEQPYEDQIPAPRQPAAASGAHNPSGGTSRRDRERERAERGGDRERSDRDRDRDRERDRDRHADRDDGHRRKANHYGR